MSLLIGNIIQNLLALIDRVTLGEEDMCGCRRQKRTLNKDKEDHSFDPSCCIFEKLEGFHRETLCNKCLV